MLIVIGIMAVVGVGISSMIVGQQREIKALSEMLSSQDLMRSLTASLAKGEVCQYVLKPLPFNASLVQAGTPQTIDLGNSPLYAGMINLTTPGPKLIQKGDQASPYSNTLEVSAIKFVIDSGNYSGAIGSFTGHWQIEFDNSKLVRAIKPVTISASIAANTTNPALALSTSCNGSSGGGGLGGRLFPADVVKNFGNTAAVPLPPTNFFGTLKYNGPVSIDTNGLLSFTNSLGQVSSCQLSTVTGSCKIGSAEFQPTYQGIVVSSCSTTPISGPSMANFGGVSVTACNSQTLEWTK